MKKVLILGSGAGGTMVAAKLRKELDPLEWKITVIDDDIVVNNRVDISTNKIGHGNTSYHIQTTIPYNGVLHYLQWVSR